MHLAPFLALLSAVSALQVSDQRSGNSSAFALTATPGVLEGWASIDLAGLATEGIAKRRAMTYCANQNAKPGMYRACKPIDSLFSGTLATLLKRNADSNTCTGSAGTLNGLAYSFYTAPDGNCKTTAETNTIKGGLNRYFDYLGNQLCGIHCVRLDHGGTYNAFITLGPEGSNLGSVSCSSVDTYVDCGNGGDNDA